MKKTIISLGLIGVFFCVSKTEASSIDVGQINSSFEIRILSAIPVLNTQNIQYTLKVSDIVNSQKISFWKIRAYCKKQTLVKLTEKGKNMCGKNQKIEVSKDNLAIFFLKNRTNQEEKFKVKLKAYDEKGRLLHTETEGFTTK